MAAYWEIAAHSACNMFLVQVSNCQFSFFPLRFWSGNFFLIAPFPDHCQLVPSFRTSMTIIIILYLFLFLDNEHSSWTNLQSIMLKHVRDNHMDVLAIAQSLNTKRHGYH